MNISELARTADTKPETIRYYERIGLLPRPRRTTGNYRDYSADDAARLTFARRARNLGFSISQVRALLNLASHNDQSCVAVDALAREHLAEVKQKLAELTRLRRKLEAVVGDCRNGSIGECRILDALTHDPPRREGRRAETKIFAP